MTFLDIWYVLALHHFLIKPCALLVRSTKRVLSRSFVKGFPMASGSLKPTSKAPTSVKHLNESRTDFPILGRGIDAQFYAGSLLWLNLMLPSAATIFVYAEPCCVTWSWHWCAIHDWWLPQREPASFSREYPSSATLDSRLLKLKTRGSHPFASNSLTCW